MKEETEAELLRQICEAPEDDAARLVYADWLIERGRPRGEFIQLQCALGHELAYPARARDRSTAPVRRPPGWEAMAERAQRLGDQLGEEWLHRPFGWWRTWYFARGFLRKVELAPSGIPLLRRVLEREPVTDIVWRPDRAGDIAKLLPELPPSVHVLEVVGHSFTGEEDEPLATSPHVEHLTTLSLGASNVDARALERLASSVHFRSLRRLVVTFQLEKVGDEGMLALASSPHLPKLEVVEVSPAGLLAVAPSTLEKCSRRFTVLS